VHAEEPSWPGPSPAAAGEGGGERARPVRLEMTVATWISLARLVLVLPMLAVLLARTPWGGWVAAGLFVAAALTDALDGHLARHRRE